jgi:hypothetical protein
MQTEYTYTDVTRTDIEYQTVMSVLQISQLIPRTAILLLLTLTTITVTIVMHHYFLLQLAGHLNL